MNYNSLTCLDWKILFLLCDGFCIPGIAYQLQITERLVERRIFRLFSGYCVCIVKT